MGISSEDYKKLLENVKSKSKSVAPKVVKTKHSKADYKDKMWATMNRICVGWITEHKFHPKRKWRFDYANKELMVAIEYEGIYGGASRHTNVVGYVKDIEKYNAAQILGWKVLRYTASNYLEMENDIRALVDSKI